MRTVSALLFTLLICPAARPDEAADLKARAIKAAAKDPADLKKFRVHTIKARGISKLAGGPVPATFEQVAVYPGQFKATWEFGAGTTKNVVTQCGADDRGWTRVGPTPAQDMSLEQVNDFRAAAYAIWVSTLVTLDDPDTKLAFAGRDKAGTHAVLGLRVTRRPWPEVTLWFDETSGLLRKMTYRSREAGAMLGKEFVYDGHKEVAGLMVPTTQTTVVQGREIYAWSEMDWAFPDKIDPQVFAKPKQ